MTDIQLRSMKESLKNAKDTGDVKVMLAALCVGLVDNAECNAHTGERTKRIETDMVEIRRDISGIHGQMANIATSRAELEKSYGEVKIGLSEVKETLAAYKYRAQGAKWLWDVLKILVGAGGGAAIVRLIGNC